jgi:hypothetical protein
LTNRSTAENGVLSKFESSPTPPAWMRFEYALFFNVKNTISWPFGQNMVFLTPPPQPVF